MGEDRQEFKRIVTDMAGQNDHCGVTAFGGVGTEQTRYQSGELLGAMKAGDDFGQFTGFSLDGVDLLNQWPHNGVDLSVGFDSFDFDDYS